MAEFTEEQVQDLIKSAVAEATKGLHTDLDIQREVDRRVGSGIQKGIETERAKWEKEFSEKAQLSAEELAKKELESKIGEITQRENEIKSRANALDAQEKLSSAGVPKSHYEKMLSVLVSSDEEVTNTRIADFIETYTAMKIETENKVKESYSNVPPPPSGDSNKSISKDDFAKMTYSEKLELKKSQPDLYTKLLTT